MEGRKGTERNGKERKGKERNGTERKGKERKGKERRGEGRGAYLGPWRELSSVKRERWQLLAARRR